MLFTAGSDKALGLHFLSGTICCFSWNSSISLFFVFLHLCLIQLWITSFCRKFFSLYSQIYWAFHLIYIYILNICISNIYIYLEYIYIYISQNILDLLQPRPPEAIAIMGYPFTTILEFPLPPFFVRLSVSWIPSHCPSLFSLSF